MTHFERKYVMVNVPLYQLYIEFPALGRDERLARLETFSRLEST